MSQMNAYEEKVPFLNRRRVLTYGSIALTSLGMGVYEAINDTTWIFRVAQVGVPLVSAYFAVRTEIKEEYGSDFDNIHFAMEEKGFEVAFTTGVGGFLGAGGSTLCQLVGVGLTNLASMFF